MKNLNKYLLYFVISFFIFSPFLVFAAIEGQNPGDGQPPANTSNKISINIDNPVAAGNIQELIDLLVNKILLPIGGLVAFMMILYSGFLFVISGSSKDGITKAKNAFYSAIIGSAIVLGSWAIGNAIKVTITQLTS